MAGKISRYGIAALVFAIGCGGGGATDTPDASPDATTIRPPVDGGQADGAVDVEPDAESGCTTDAECDDGLDCNLDRCVSGVCESETDPDACDDGNPCTAGECTASGCATVALEEGSACADAAGNEGTCRSALCATGCTDASECDDGIPCTLDACNAEAGVCSNVLEDSACDDGVACTTDRCTPTGCESAPVDTACDDGIACTADTCGESGCEHAASDAACDDGIACTADACDAASGCRNVPDATACDDMEPCTANMCDVAASCTAAAVPDDTPCRDATDREGYCAAGACTVDCVDAAGCDNGDPCDGAERCVEGRCRAGSALRCDDEVDCTTDRCTTGVGCAHTPTAGACDDGNPCTADACGGSGCSRTNVDDGMDCTSAAGDAGSCASGECVTGCLSNADCDDGVACTRDRCRTNGSCRNEPLATRCDDGVACTRDSCNATSGCAFAPSDEDCDDSNPCTVNGCDASGGCESVNAMDGIGCSSAGGDAGLCLGGVCDVECTSDGDCDDGDVCTGAERCNLGTGQCVVGTPLSCDDGFPCTDDSCDATGGCMNAPVDSRCGDGVDCTSDSCEVGSGCSNAPQGGACDDGNPCTTSLCDQALGCQATSVMDGTSCMTAMGGIGSCQDGSCETRRIYRINSLTLQEPHLIVDYGVFGCNFCDDITNVPGECSNFFATVPAPAVNPSLLGSVTTDGDDADMLLDSSFVFVTDPLTQDGTDGSALRILTADCESATSCVAPDMPTLDLSTTYDSSAAGSGEPCLAPLAGTTHSGPWPDGTTSTINTVTPGSNGCFHSAELPVLSFPLDIDGNQLELPLVNANVAAQFDGNPASGLTTGLIRGFLTEEAADDINLIVDSPLGAQMVNLGRDLLPDNGDGPDACATATHCSPAEPDDVAVGDERDEHNATCGWWFYINFTATRVADASGF